jgi:hypothetical protein
MVYTDGLHIVADTEEELHEFAKRIGLKREWFQDHPEHPHYDLLGCMSAKAEKNGAAKIRPRDLLRKSMEMKHKSNG